MEEEIKKQTVAEMKEENEVLEKNIALKKEMKAQEDLSSSAGGHIETTPAKEETAKEYADKVMGNESK